MFKADKKGPGRPRTGDTQRSIRMKPAEWDLVDQIAAERNALNDPSIGHFSPSRVLRVALHHLAKDMQENPLGDEH